MLSLPSNEIRCPYCWSEQNKQVSHIAAYPHPFLRTQDDYVRSIYRFIKQKDGIEKENVCINCGKIFSIIFFKENPQNEQSKRIFDICNGVIKPEKYKPLFEKFVKNFFNFVEKNLFTYKIYPSTQSLCIFLAAFGLLVLFYSPYFFTNIANHGKLFLTTFDYYVILILVLSSFLLTFLFNLIKENDTKLSVKKLDFGLHGEYKKSNWGAL
jgi:hypothetical protein